MTVASRICADTIMRMRASNLFFGTTKIEYLSQAGVTADAMWTEFFEGSDIEQLEREMQAVILKAAQRSIPNPADPDDARYASLVFVDMAGGGDGQKLMVQMVFGLINPNTGGEVSPGLIVDGGIVALQDGGEDFMPTALMFQAQGQPEVAKARADAWSRLPSVSTLPDGVEEFAELQVIAVGASQGRPFTGLVLTFPGT